MTSEQMTEKLLKAPGRRTGPVTRNLILVATMFLSILAVQCQSAEPSGANSEAQGVPLGLSLVDALVEYHRTKGTHLDGPRCPMYPSCASYAHRAIRTEGWYGFLLFVDRLFFREGGDLSNRYPITPRRLSDAPRYYDPLEASTGQRPRLGDPSELRP